MGESMRSEPPSPLRLPAPAAHHQEPHMIQLPASFFAARGVRVIGAGAYVPPRAIDNAHITSAIPGWSAERVAEKTQIRERRFLWELDRETGVAVCPPEGEPASN